MCQAPLQMFCLHLLISSSQRYEISPGEVQIPPYGTKKVQRSNLPGLTTSASWSQIMCFGSSFWPPSQFIYLKISIQPWQTSWNSPNWTYTFTSLRFPSHSHLFSSLTASVRSPLQVPTLWRPYLAYPPIRIHLSVLRCPLLKLFWHVPHQAWDESLGCLYISPAKLRALGGQGVGAWENWDISQQNHLSLSSLVLLDSFLLLRPSWANLVFRGQIEMPECMEINHRIIQTAAYHLPYIWHNYPTSNMKMLYCNNSQAEEKAVLLITWK